MERVLFAARKARKVLEAFDMLVDFLPLSFRLIVRKENVLFSSHALESTFLLFLKSCVYAR